MLDHPPINHLHSATTRISHQSTTPKKNTPYQRPHGNLRAPPPPPAQTYLTCGLKLSASSATMRGHCCGTFMSTKPRHMTAARRTSSLTSLTAKCSSFWMAPLLSVPLA